MVSAPAPADYKSYKFFTVTFPSAYTAHVEINRASKLNAFHPPMFVELGQIFQQLSPDPSVRAIVLSGAGDRAFTAGLDVQAASAGPLTTDANPDPARQAAALRRHIDELQASVTAIEKCEKPVIVVLHGVSYGLAIDVATSCDVRIAAQDARLSVREVEIGLAADLGTLSRLPRANVPMSWVKDVCLTARVWDAQEALRVGFVSEVHESKAAALQKAHALAQLIATKSPVAVQSTKEVLNFSRDHTIDEGLNYVKIWNAAALQTQDVKDAMLAGIQRRTPTFEKL